MADPMGKNFWEGVLGVVNINFNGVDLGKTTADTEIVIEQDIKDILFQQDGTQFADKVRTGMAISITATFGEISTALLETIQSGFVKVGENLKISRSLYQSMKDTEAKPMTLTRIDSEGDESTNPLYKLNVYKAVPIITGNIVYGADTQRGIGVTFYCFWDSTKKAFAYSGYASSLGL
jgi:hypothetical protein